MMYGYCTDQYSTVHYSAVQCSKHSIRIRDVTVSSAPLITQKTCINHERVLLLPIFQRFFRKTKGQKWFLNTFLSCVKHCFCQTGGGELEGCCWCAACAVSNVITFYNKQSNLSGFFFFFLHVEEKYCPCGLDRKKYLFQRNAYLYVPCFTWIFLQYLVICRGMMFSFFFLLYCRIKFPWWDQVLLLSCRNTCHCKSLLVQKWLTVCNVIFVNQQHSCLILWMCISIIPLLLLNNAML